MEKPLAIGIAGLGTVGAALVGIIHSKDNALAERCGRAVRVTGVSTRDANKDRGIDLANAEWFSDPVVLATSDIDVFVELMGGDEGAALDSVRAA
ncbi:MAG: homoserine dehydrogenase, partial [Hyphomicrobiales bacterium]|nr:homoserine dehydrogenase [Hyphomicrobiales bacterium]